MTVTTTKASENIESYISLISHEPPEDLKVEKKNAQPKDGKYKFLFWEFETPVIWGNVILITIFHIIAVYALFEHFIVIRTPGIILYCLILGGICGFGITAGAHRYWTHRSYKAKLPLRVILLICYSCAGQNSIVQWVRDHRVHHKFSETDADPHNSNRGFFFSHVGWLMTKKHPEVLSKGKTIDCSDLLEDPLVAFHERHFMLFKILCCFIVPTIIPPFLYGETWYTSIMGVCFVRYVVSLNSTWAVNSFAHFYGNKPYDKRIRPVENTGVSLFAMGEGYHNYHHTFPWDYRAAELGMALNITTLWLDFFGKIGWAYDLKVGSDELKESMIMNHGDGTYHKKIEDTKSE
ncbi:unnamed protein product [Acanthoscelides obtectus]|uniref:Fatty acid desaturase domain-containing protein n=2 Tax=Acanthoscelides obtectus TaxID=200917 RepID=A0A9P0JRX2_ACAOB|nr:unnamed protein product [Acanthoscelides obtectus]CAK1625911.1 hypothetical protein AOBTE_LOCUS3466 [Acanthoscelides obtectus]